jgi:hypothetical protein
VQYVPEDHVVGVPDLLSPRKFAALMLPPVSIPMLEVDVNRPMVDSLDSTGTARTRRRAYCGELGADADAFVDRVHGFVLHQAGVDLLELLGLS